MNIAKLLQKNIKLIENKYNESDDAMYILKEVEIDNIEPDYCIIIGECTYGLNDIEGYGNQYYNTMKFEFKVKIDEILKYFYKHKIISKEDYFIFKI